MTVPTRTSPDPSAWTAGTPAMTTGDLIRRRAAATQEGERMALDAEMNTRWIKVHVEVITAQEDPDEVYVYVEHDGRSHETGDIDLGTGDQNTFWIRLSRLMPVTGPITVKVYDSDVLSDDLISQGTLEDAAVTDNAPYDEAEYHMTAEFHPH